MDVEALLRRAQMRTMQIVVATPLPDAHRTCKLPFSQFTKLPTRAFQRALFGFSEQGTCAST